jgi:hypothetical protein
MLSLLHRVLWVMFYIFKVNLGGQMLSLLGFFLWVIYKVYRVFYVSTSFILLHTSSPSVLTESIVNGYVIVEFRLSIYFFSVVILYQIFNLNLDCLYNNFLC